MDVMLDLETLSTNGNAVILAVGAVEIKNKTIGREFYERVSLQSSIDAAFTLDALAIQFWMTQNHTAQECLYGVNSITKVLAEFARWIDCRSFVWGNGASFDNAILANAYTRVGQTIPWSYGKNRCYRTIKDIYPEVSQEANPMKHNAREDALCQAKHLIAINNQHPRVLGRV